jgi:hypothetical protein
MAGYDGVIMSNDIEFYKSCGLELSGVENCVFSDKKFFTFKLGDKETTVKERTENQAYQSAAEIFGLEEV